MHWLEEPSSLFQYSQKGPHHLQIWMNPIPSSHLLAKNTQWLEVVFTFYRHHQVNILSIDFCDSYTAKDQYSCFLSLIFQEAVELLLLKELLEVLEQRFSQEGCETIKTDLSLTNENQQDNLLAMNTYHG